MIRGIRISLLMHNIREVVAFVMESKYGENQKKKKTLAIFTLKASFFIS
jgi:hypothetical protein